MNCIKKIKSEEKKPETSDFSSLIESKKRIQK